MKKTPTEKDMVIYSCQWLCVNLTSRHLLDITINYVVHGSYVTCLSNIWLLYQLNLLQLHKILKECIVMWHPHNMNVLWNKHCTYKLDNKIYFCLVIMSQKIILINKLSSFVCVSWYNKKYRTWKKIVCSSFDVI